MSKILKSLTPCLAILSIAGLEFYAISQGINGVLLAGSIAAISGIGGYQIKKITEKKNE